MDNKNNEDLEALKVQTDVKGVSVVEEALDTDGEVVQPKVRNIPEKSQYFGHPTDWDRSFAAFQTATDFNDKMEQAKFHRVALNEVRKALGSKCIHLIHVTEPDNLITWRAKVKTSKGVKTINVESEKESKDLVADSYKSLKDVLANAITS